MTFQLQMYIKIDTKIERVGLLYDGNSNQLMQKIKQCRWQIFQKV
jgi:hypothetical protein